MAYSSGYTAVTGATYTAAQYNTYTRDNFSAIWVFTTAGDLAYATSATTRTRLAIGSNGGILKSTGSAPAWVAAGAAGSLFYNNGANTPAWLTVGANGSYLSSNGSAPAWLTFYRSVCFLLNTDVDLIVGDNAYRWRVPAHINGWSLYSVAAFRAAGTGILTIQVRKNLTDDMLSTKLTVDSGENDSATAATPAVIDAAKKTVATGDKICIDVDVAGTSTTYSGVELVFAL